MAYATVADVQARITRTMTTDEQTVCAALLDDAGAMIDAFRESACYNAKKIVSCRMVLRAFGADADIPTGATQGSMSGLGYSQSWTIGTGGAVGELYLSKADRQLLGGGNSIASHSPLEDMVYERYDGNFI